MEQEKERTEFINAVCGLVDQIKELIKDGEKKSIILIASEDAGDTMPQLVCVHGSSEMTVNGLMSFATQDDTKALLGKALVACAIQGKFSKN